MTMEQAQRKNAARDVERKLEDFYDALDRIVPTGVDSGEWLGFVEGHIGSGGVMEGYGEWVAECWETLEVAA